MSCVKSFCCFVLFLFYVLNSDSLLTVDRLAGDKVEGDNRVFLALGDEDTLMPVLLDDDLCTCTLCTSATCATTCTATASAATTTTSTTATACTATASAATTTTATTASAEPTATATTATTTTSATTIHYDVVVTVICLLGIYILEYIKIFIFILFLYKTKIFFPNYVISFFSSLFFTGNKKKCSMYIMRLLKCKISQDCIICDAINRIKNIYYYYKFLFFLSPPNYGLRDIVYELLCTFSVCRVCVIFVKVVNSFGEARLLKRACVDIPPLDNAQ